MLRITEGGWGHNSVSVAFAQDHSPALLTLGSSHLSPQHLGDAKAPEVGSHLHRQFEASLSHRLLNILFCGFVMVSFMYWPK